MTDIVIMTCGRLPLLKRTLAYLWERTSTPYRLQIIDDASENAGYVRVLQVEGKIVRARVHTQRVGISHHLRTLKRITASDPMVFSDDDILVPRLEPDWLAQGLAAMKRYSDLGILALNTPGCNVRHSRGDIEPAGEITYCRNVPGAFCFVRRAVLAKCPPPDGVESPVKWMCASSTEAGWRVAYLTHVYAQHIGPVSMRTGRDWSRDLERVLPVDSETLAPPEEYRW